MTAGHWEELRVVVEEVLALPPEQRAAYLEAKIDPALRAEAERLLSYAEEASVALPAGLGRNLFARFSDVSLSGITVGAYRLLGELGRGGMGAVYLAERADGEYQQQVAVKVLQESIFTPSLAERFRTERQILARLSNPAIARLLDGGVLEDGRPFLVLEYVDGKPVDKFCDEKGLGVEARLELFLLIADAVQSAHEQLVLHLDLKPANILVTAAGEPKLLDFGIARVLGEGSDETEATARLLTPRYASPEQTRGQSLSVSSDVFSLATMLYLLLTGTLPYDVEGTTALETARLIATEEPKVPSVAARGGPGGEARADELRGDLDAILLKALRKEPKLRYATVGAFAADIRRHMESVPVQARAGTFRYRAGRFAARHRAGVVAGALALATVAVSVGFIVHATVVARRERALAERRLNDVHELAKSYIFDLDPKLEEVPGTLEVRHFVLQNAQKYLESMASESAGNDDLVRETARGYFRIGGVQSTPGMPSLTDWAGAEHSLLQAVALQQSLVDRHPGEIKDRVWLLRSWMRLESLPASRGDMQQAWQWGLQAWEAGQPILAAGPATAHFIDVGNVAWDMATQQGGNGDLWNFADPQKAAEWLQRSREVAKKRQASLADPMSDQELLALLERQAVTQADILVAEGHLPEAGPLYRESLRINALTKGRLVEEEMRKLLRQFYAGYLLRVHDAKGADALAPMLLPKSFHEKGQDRLLSSDEGDELALLARIDMENGRVAAGKLKMRAGLDTLQSLYKSLPEDANGSSELAWDSYRLGEETVLDAGTRRQLYVTARDVAETYGRAHATVLSAFLLSGKCELGLAGLARGAGNRAEQSEHAERAAAKFQYVLKALPTQPEAGGLLAQAEALR